MRKVYILMAAAAILMVGCKGNGSKKAKAAEPAAEEAAAPTAQQNLDNAIKAIEEASEVDARDAVEKLAAAQGAELAESIEETLKKNPDAVIPFAAVENKPTFNGGDANEFSKWVASELKYPQQAIDDQIEGKVILKFNVTKEGEVKDVEVVKGVNEALDAEAVRVVSASPKWAPGNQNGTPVAVNYIFPVVFKLQ